MAIASLIGTLVSMVIYPAYGWNAVFIFFGVFNIIAFMLLLFFKEKPNKPEEKYKLYFSFK